MRTGKLHGTLSTLRRWIALIVLLPMVVAGVAGLAYFYAVDDVYTARASLYIQPPDAVRSDAAASAIFINDCRELFDRSPVVARSAEALGLPSVSIEARAIPGTHIIEITASGEEAALCADAANTASRLYKEYVEGLMDAASVTITEEASTPSQPSGPPQLRNTLLVFAATLSLCLLVAVLVSLSRTKLRNAAQIESSLGQAVLGVLPDYRRDASNYTDKEKPSVNSLYWYVSDDVREQIKAVATSISVSISDPVKCFSLTSTARDEGKTSMAVLLASAFAEQGRLTLLVDADCRNPGVRRYIKRESQLDLTDYLSGHAPLEDVITPTPVRNLFFIDSNHPEASLAQLVQAEGFERFLTLSRESFEVIIFDAPPLNRTNDVIALTKELDSTAMVIASGKVRASDAKGALDRLAENGVHTLGIILEADKGNESH